MDISRFGVSHGCAGGTVANAKTADADIVLPPLLTKISSQSPTNIHCIEVLIRDTI